LGLVLVGTEDTKNDLADEANDGSSYQHVSVLTSLQKPDLKMLESIKSVLHRFHSSGSAHTVSGNEN
jgi:hypothetical protein